MGRDRGKESWELAAEELVRLVRGILDDHGPALERALRNSLSEDEARAHVEQLDLLVRVLEIELWRKGMEVAGSGLVASTARGLKVALATVGITLTTLATTQAYEAVAKAETQADQVIQCVVKGDPDALPDRPAQTSPAGSEAVESSAREGSLTSHRDPGRGNGLVDVDPVAEGTSAPRAEPIFGSGLLSEISPPPNEARSADDRSAAGGPAETL